MPRKVSLAGLWTSTIGVLILAAVQGWSGSWALFYLVWPGYNSGNAFLNLVVELNTYHMRPGFFVIGAVAILVVIFAFLAKTNLYVRILAVIGLALTLLAAWGGLQFVISGYQDRLSLGQMADSFIGVLAAYFLELFFINRVPRFPWSRAKEA